MLGTKAEELAFEGFDFVIHALKRTGRNGVCAQERNVKMEKKMTRRNVMAGGLGLTLAGLLNETAFARETVENEKCWTYVKLDPQKVAQSVYETFGAHGCMYGAVKGALKVYAEQSDGPDAQAAKAFPCQVLRYGRAGVAHLKEICGAVSGGVMFMSFFVEDYADIRVMAAELAKFSAEAELPTFIPEVDEHPDFLRVVSNGITCREMGGAWVKAASEKQMKIVLERCRRHAASIMAKAVEILNAHYA